MPEFNYLGQIFLAVILGAIVGLQREQWGRPAGPRTYALVCAGSALFTILSVSAFGVSDVTRVASQIVIGIGFLGAGIIMHHEQHVEGLTTAAGLWVMAAIGMAVGVRYYILAAGVTLGMLILLMIDDRRLKKQPDDAPSVVKRRKKK